MKKLLFLLLLFPFISFGQTLPLSYTSVSGTIDGFTFPKNTLSYSLPGTANIRLYTASAGAVWGSRPYTDFTYNGNPFPSRDSLVNWITANMFSNTSGGGSVVADTNVVTSAASYPITTAGYYTFTGTTSTFTLPAISGTIGRRIVIVNAGTGNITLNSNAGANDIWETGANKNTVTISSGEVRILVNNSIKHVLIN